MIKPEKYMDLDNSVLSMSALILKQLKKNSLLKHSEIFNFIIREKGENSRVVFLPALSFLFLLNKIEYHQEIDTLELKK